ncbi:MAG: hypothetical protein AAB415_00795 [Patescibacteria group bacterium]
MSKKNRQHGSGDKKIRDQIAEQRQSATFWRDHINGLYNEGLVSDWALQKLINLGVTKADNLGHQVGKIRPGYPGRYDVYYSISMEGVTEAERFLLSALSVDEIIILERDVRVKETGFNPNDPDELAEFYRIRRMPPDEIKRELEYLESLLAS